MTTPRQTELFSDEVPWEVDDQQIRRVAAVVMPEGVAGPFDYLVPDALADALSVGCRVRVPFGRSNRQVVAYCVGLQTQRVGAARARKLKPIRSVVDRPSLLSPSMLETTRWMAEHYLTHWGQVLRTVVPSAVRGRAGTRMATLLQVAETVAVDRIERLGLPPKQAAALTALAKATKPLTMAELARAAACTSAPITALRKKGLIISHTARVQSFVPESKAHRREPAKQLNPDQQSALAVILAAIEAGTHKTILMHGVTGSGKTEVYIQAIQRVARSGRQAIVLVPEISLTPQTTARFQARLDRVAVMHSHLTDVQRHWYWQEIASGGVQVIVGARSAVFAPTPQLGLIILDEEHESTFKQDTAPRYHAREVARHRAAAEGVPLILGSATPSLESWQKGVDGTYQLVEMPRRVLNLRMPDVVTVNLTEEARDRHSRGAISRRLRQAIDAALREGGQVILLLNRRGYSTHIQCPACGFVARCPHCDIALTHHRHNALALCHYCDHQIPAPAECPECRSREIRYGGLGTERLEAEVRARFPHAPCLRMDTDSMKRRGSHEKALDAFRHGKVRILLGTQMIAKGLDFPNVTLVGVINADTSLHLPDFRAAERTFHLVTQVAGRTGRGEKGGRVVVQTFDPDHPAIQAAARHDFHRFAAEELAVRKRHGYPPFTEIVRMVLRGPVEKVVDQFARHTAERIAAAAEAQRAEARVLGPAPAPFARLRGKYRFHIQTHSRHGTALRAAMRQVLADLKAPRDVEWIVDVDPLDMM